jgi:hypothetical protein
VGRQRRELAAARRNALRLCAHPARLRARARRADLVRYHLAQTVRPGTGRLLVSDYAADPAAGHPAAAETLTALGFRCAGQTSGGGRTGRPAAPTAWIIAP